MAAFRECGIISYACKDAKISRQSHYNWLISDPEYKRQFKDAKRDASESLEAEARLRATVGEMRLKFHRGEPIMVTCREDDPEAIEIPDKPGQFHKPYMEFSKSDNLLMFILKKLDPSYRENYDHPHRDVGDSMAGLSHDEAMRGLLNVV